MTQHLDEIWNVARRLDDLAVALEDTGNPTLGKVLAHYANRLDTARLAIDEEATATLRIIAYGQLSPEFVVRHEDPDA